MTTRTDESAKEPTEPRSIAFVGLGTMGKAMARRLLGAGYEVTVWNRSRGPVDELAVEGARPAAGLDEAFDRPLVLSMLADDASVRERVLDSGVLRGAACRTHVNMATVSARFAAELAHVHADAGLGYVSAPVLGRATAAETGQLRVLAAGPPAEVQALAPVLSAFASSVVNLGSEAPCANAVKIAVNFLVASAIEAMSEGAALVESFGVDRRQFIDVLTGSVLPGPVYSGYGMLIADRSYEPPGFTARLGFKDVGLAVAAGNDRNVPLPLASLVQDSLVTAIAHGWAEMDWAVLGEVSRLRAAQPVLSGHTQRSTPDDAGRADGSRTRTVPP